MEGPVFWAVAVVAAMLIGMSKGGLPMVGALAVPVLSMTISPVTAAGLLLPVFVLSDMFGLYVYRRYFDRRVVGYLAIGGTAGIGIGWATAHLVTEAQVKFLIGAIGLAFATSRILGVGRNTAPRQARLGPGVFWGTLSGFTSFVSHAGGPPYQVYVLPLKLTKSAFAGTSTVFFAYVNALKIVPYWTLGQLSPANLKVAAVLTVPAIVAVFLGYSLVKILPEKRFFAIVTGALFLVSLKLIWDAVT